ncbi:hypothetical protein RI054_01g02310 [Pseudoscourfieldia marina]
MLSRLRCVRLLASSSASSGILLRPLSGGGSFGFSSSASASASAAGDAEGEHEKKSKQETTEANGGGANGSSGGRLTRTYTNEYTPWHTDTKDKFRHISSIGELPDASVAERLADFQKIAEEQEKKLGRAYTNEYTPWHAPTKDKFRHISSIGELPDAAVAERPLDFGTPTKNKYKPGVRSIREAADAGAEETIKSAKS